MNLLSLGAPEGLPDCLPHARRIKIKLEIDTGPPAGADYDVETLLVPIPFQVKLFTVPCLFAGKLHAVLCRNWKARVKEQAKSDVRPLIRDDAEPALWSPEFFHRLLGRLSGVESGTKFTGL